VIRCVVLAPSDFYFPKLKEFMKCIGGFRDTYLGRQVVSRPGGPRAGMGSAGGLRSVASSPSGVYGAEPQPKSNLVPF